jgi:hypothetical protein
MRKYRVLIVGKGFDCDRSGAIGAHAHTQWEKT